MEDEVDTHIHRDEIFPCCRARLLTRTTAEWIALMRPRGVWCGPVYGYRDVVDDPQVRHNGAIVEYEHPARGPGAYAGISDPLRPDSLQHRARSALGGRAHQ